MNYEFDNYIRKKHKLKQTEPFCYKLNYVTDLHMELDNHILCVWFGLPSAVLDANDGATNREVNIPDGFKIYDSTSNEVHPYRNTQTFTLDTNDRYILYYNDDPIIKFETHMYLTYPPIIEHQIITLVKKMDVEPVTKVS